MQAPYFDDLLDIVIPFQPEECFIKVSGRCWQEGLFLKGVQYQHASDDPFKHSLLHPASDAERAVREVSLIFKDAVRLGEAKSATFEVSAPACR